MIPPDFFSDPQAYIEGSFLLALFAAYAGGVLASFTPCVYPIIPITVAYIGADKSTSRLRGFLLSIFYVLGLALTYTTLGAFAALTGRLFGQIQTSPWVYFIVANVCIFMGLSMLGLFSVTIPLPKFITGTQARKGEKGLWGSFIVGAISGLIAGPCTTPILTVLFSLVAARQNIYFGMLLLFFFSLGMGTLLIVIGTFAKLLASIPKSGAWMTVINRIFAVILMCVGEYFLIKTGTMII